MTAMDKVSSVLEQLRRKPLGVHEYSVLNNGYHIRVIGDNGKVVDWWPSKDKWLFIDEASRENPKNTYITGTPTLLFSMLISTPCNDTGVQHKTVETQSLDFSKLHDALGNLIVAASNVMVELDKVQKRSQNESRIDKSVIQNAGRAEPYQEPSADWEEYFNA